MKITFAAVMLLAAPPPEFDHEPVVPYRVEIVEPAGVAEYCPAPFGVTAVGCTVFGRVILLRNDLDPEALAHVLRHEKGHINGWTHD